MTRTSFHSRATTWGLTAIAAAFFLLLSGAFGAGLLAGPLWNGANWLNSPAITYLLVAVIVAAGIAQAHRLPAIGATSWALLALPLRFFVGRMWLSSGLGKVGNPAWTGTGEALHGFWQNAAAVNDAGQGKITYDWYRRLLLFMDSHHWYVWFAKLIAGGELLVGLALLLGGVVGIAALGGAFLNVNYGLAGSASANPVLMTFGILLVLAWRTAGYWGVDRWLLPLLGRPRPSTPALPADPAAVAPANGVAGMPRPATPVVIWSSRSPRIS